MAQITKSYSQYGTSNWVSARLIMAVFAVLGWFPYRWRIFLGGLFFRRVVSPISKNRKRILNNLALVRPDLPQDQAEALVKSVPMNVGRTLTELFFPADFLQTVADTPVKGPGLDALLQARDENRPVILFSAHFGNYDVVRATLIKRGCHIGGLYKPMRNGFFNDYYLSKISQIGKPLFSTEGRGMGEMVAHLRRGGMLAMLVDQHSGTGEPLKMMGKTAYTPLSAPKMALKYNALLVPTFAIRRADGVHFDMVVETPITHSDPLTMAQDMNDIMEHYILEHMDQWLWSHRRWKGAYPDV